VFEINKGVNKYPDEITVSAPMAPDDRRIPFDNMVYIADGPSDVPVFSILTSTEAALCQVKTLAQQGRVQGYGPADYSEGTHTDMWLRSAVEDIALRIVHGREEALGDRVGRPPRHILEGQSATATRPSEDPSEPAEGTTPPDEASA